MKRKYWGSSSEDEVKDLKKIDMGFGGFMPNANDSNIVHFFSDVDIEPTYELFNTIEDKKNSLLSLSVKYGIEPPPIKLYVNSPGGFLSDGLSILDFLRLTQKQIPIDTYVTGHVASAATFMTICGRKRYMHKNAVMTIHQLSSGFWGRYEDIKDEVVNLDSFMKIISEIYTEYTKLPMSKLKTMLRNDLHFRAEECKQYGLVDEII